MTSPNLSFKFNSKFQEISNVGKRMSGCTSYQLRDFKGPGFLKYLVLIGMEWRSVTIHMEMEINYHPGSAAYLVRDKIVPCLLRTLT